ncbi:MAG TPA: hypothetical protein VHG70_04010 [Nocardioidaceae bacterium]|nr:hypothetical protein [Nocardioidaceae bacterium]
MSRDEVRMPDVVPVLSRGKHRNPRKGGCFMEFASFLAGERWSDHPRCTHPLLAALARDVNDHVSDDARGRLVPLIPSVIGVTGDDPRIDVEIALRVATRALPVAASDRQRALAVSVIRCEQLLAAMDGRPEGSMRAASREALEQVPQATKWAHTFVNQAWGKRRQNFARHTGPGVVHYAVESIAKACVTDADDILCRLLSDTIDFCVDTVGTTTAVEPLRPLADGKDLPVRPSLQREA